MRIALALVASLLAAGAAAQPEDRSGGVRENVEQVQRWNRFAVALLAAHHRRIDRPGVVSTERIGGYGGAGDLARFYREVEYRDAGDGRLLARIRWERDRPRRVHVIEIYYHDERGRVVRDYAAAYLPHFRNAPIQTLVNLHAYDGDLHAFRQFDASGNRIYERCEGEHLGEPVRLSLPEERLPFTPDADDPGAAEAYVACFGFLPVDPGPYLDPLEAESGSRSAVTALPGAAEPRDAAGYVERARARFRAGDLAAAVADLDRAIALDRGHDEAYFWRGMALGRVRRFAEAERDLGVYIDRHPDSSLAYTKRGIRRLWAGSAVAAEHDFRRALALDPANAEARDDLGVILARRGEHGRAAEMFRQVVRIEPSYFKAHHNLAISLLATGDTAAALASVDRALLLAPADRDTVLLKAEILAALGRHGQARALREAGALLPEGEWSERLN